MLYNRQTFWLLQKKYTPLENHFMSISRLQIKFKWVIFGNTNFATKQKKNRLKINKIPLKYNII